MTEMRRFRVRLRGKRQVELEGQGVEVRDSCLVVVKDSHLVAVFTPNEWEYVREIEAGPAGYRPLGQTFEAKD